MFCHIPELFSPCTIKCTQPLCFLFCQQLLFLLSRNHHMLQCYLLLQLMIFWLQYLLLVIFFFPLVIPLLWMPLCLFQMSFLLFQMALLPPCASNCFFSSPTTTCCNVTSSSNSYASRCCSYCSYYSGADQANASPQAKMRSRVCEMGQLSLMQLPWCSM